MHTELGRSQVQVQRCILSRENSRLKSSSAHCARKLAKRLAKSWQGGSGRGSGGRDVEEKEEDEERRRRRTTAIKSYKI